jgi:hypothetical protein
MMFSTILPFAAAAFAPAWEPAELLPDVLVVGLQQHDGVGGHASSLGG